MEAELKAAALFAEIEKRGLLVAGKTEKVLNKDIFDLAYELYGIEKYWHKRIVRAGKNTLKPYDENPEDLTLQEDDILFIDFGPIFDEWEADFGRTFVLGNDPIKHKIKEDTAKAWKECKDYFDLRTEITGAEFYAHVVATAQRYGWEFGGEIAGHLIGHFPHEKLEKEIKTNYVHPNNHQNMLAPDTKGNKREWILEIHFVDREREIGSFYEQLLT
ncbi:M24 family metallopeptidase [Sediminicola sp. 1XM1-17]|uniref:M24 family metallopeptidase n=1 Tax=Sediminicola sp. 1XM1-17 TaxID=3127702 RepID=UPI003077DA44